MRQTNEAASPARDWLAPWAPLVGGVVMVLVALGCGCRVAHTAAGLPVRAIRSATGIGGAARAFNPVVLQQRLMRFADDYSGRLEVGLDSLPWSTNSAGTIARLKLKLDCVGNIYAVATGPNELMNLADMFVLVTLTKVIIEEQWPFDVYGESARPILAACQNGETNITAIALTVVSPQQLNELRAAIAQWRQEHPDLRSALFARGLGFEVEITARQQQTEAASGSLLSLLRLDPLAGLDPAARELAQTRLFGERALFLGQRKPTLVRWQAQLLALEAAEMPAVREVRTNTMQLAAALERAGKTVADLPALVRSEREAILEALPPQERALTNLAGQLSATLQAGTKLSESLNTTLQTARGLHETIAAESASKRKSAGPAPRPPTIEDYTQSAKQVELAARQLTELLRALNQTVEPTNLARLSAQVTPVVQQAQAGGRAVADYVFRRAILLVGFICVLVLVTALAFQWIRKRANLP